MKEVTTVENKTECHDAYVAEFDTGKRWCWATSRGYAIIRHCPECGSPLGFDSEGNPTVGASYEELEGFRNSVFDVLQREWALVRCGSRRPERCIVVATETKQFHCHEPLHIDMQRAIKWMDGEAPFRVGPLSDATVSKEADSEKPTGRA